MRQLKWYHLLLIALGGFIVLAIVYFALRASGVIDRFRTSGQNNV